MSADSLALALMDLDDVSVGRTDGELVVACRGHDGQDTIETESVHDLIAKHGFRVRNTVAEFDAGEVRLSLTEKGAGDNGGESA